MRQGVYKTNPDEFKILFDSMPGLYLILSPDLIILAVSSQYEQANFLKREDIVGKELISAIPNFFDVQLDGRDNENFNSLMSVRREKRANAITVQRRDVLKPDGSLEERYWSVSNKPVLNHKNEIVYIIHKVEDISRLATIKDQLHAKYKIIDDLNAANVLHEIELSNRLKELQQINLNLEYQIRLQATALDKANKDIVDYQYALNVADIIVTTSADGKIDYVNDNFCAISGYSREELVGKDHRLLKSGYHSKEFMQKLWKTIRSGQIWKGDICNRSKTGAIYWVSTTIFPFLDDEGKPLRYLSVHSDITEQMRKTAALALSEEKYRTIFSNSLLAIFTANIHEPRIIDVNDKGVSLFGYKSKTDFLENYKSSMHLTDPDGRNSFLEKLKAEGEFSVTNYKLQKLDGTVFRANIFSKLNDSQTLAHTFVLDVTQQVHFTEQLEEKVKERTLALTESLTREKALNEMKSQFIGVVSHEFRTPLTTILSSVSLLKSYIDPQYDDKGNKHIHRISSAVNNLTSILNDFLTMEKLRIGMVTSKSHVFNLPVFMRSIIDELDEMLTERKQSISYSHQGNESITASPTIIKNIVLNLLSNASKYSDDGKEIVFKSLADDSQVKIIVSDSGIGIPENEQEKVFSEFFRAQNVKNIQGTGLGLSIVSKYLILLGGNITFTSEANKGTTFNVELPQGK